VKQLVLIDGHSVIYRSFFAFIRQPLRNSQGFNTSAVFGFANTLRKLLAELKPEYCAVVYDTPGKTFRHEMYEQYKIQRPPAPEELPPQMPILKEMVTAWGIASFEQPGVEADDVLGTLARRFAGEGFEVVLVTSDKDLLQLVGNGIAAYDPWKGVRYGPDEVKEKMGVSPAQVPDFLALSGDTSDNIPGVPGIGPRRAQQILAEWQTLDRAIQNDPRVRGHAEIARVSRDLATVRADVDVKVESDQLRLKPRDEDRLSAIFKEMGFRDMLEDLAPATATVKEAPFAGVDELVRGRRVGVWYEAGVGLWASAGAEQVTLIPAGDRLGIEALLSDSSVTKVGADLKGQLKAMHADGLDLKPPLFDVGVAAWLVDPNLRRYGLEDVTLQVLGKAVALPSAQARAAQALRLHQALEPQVLAMGLGRVMGELEMPLAPILAAMEERGVKVDVEYLGELDCELSEELERIEQGIHKLAGHEFNVSSPKQLGQVLFEELKLAKSRKTKTGFSTSVDVLNELAPQHPIVREVLRHRELSKLCGTYLGPLRELADPKTCRIHASLNQTGTATGRLSSSDPNLQNIPIRTEIGRKIRRAFVAGRGNVLVSADYSQIELRVLAHLSGDEELTEAFRRGEDIHARTAAAILRKDIKSVNQDDRRLAKMVNYGLVYGMGDHGLSSRAEIPIEQARAFLDEYMLRFSGVAKWREQIVEQAKQSGFVRTISGRIRPTPGIADRNRAVAEATRRYALNAPVQGSAADIIKQAMVRLELALAGEGAGIGMILQVHDELLFEVVAGQADRVVGLVKSEMEGAWKLSVPLAVEVGRGRNWGEAH
jgi:DNA polymerase-1